MTTKIDARDDVNPDEGEDKYGDVEFADPVNKKMLARRTLEQSGGSCAPAGLVSKRLRHRQCAKQELKNAIREIKRFA